jgi:hypothetical protein
MIQLAESAATATFDETSAQNASLWGWENFADESTKREFSKIVDIGTAILSDDDFNRVSLLLLLAALRYHRQPVRLRYYYCLLYWYCSQMNQVGADMEQIYNTATVCGRPGYDPSLCYPLDPGQY